MQTFNNQRVTLILRSCQGGGKTTFANYIKSLNPSAVICSADDHFTDNNGNYNFDPAKLGGAHKQCRENFVLALSEGKPLVIVSNTNSKACDFNFYLAKSREWGYSVFSIVIENRHGNTNNHGVNSDTIAKCAENIKNSLKLF